MSTTLMSSTAAVIERVLNDILTSPERWTQGCSARDGVGNAVCYDSNSASRFCMMGAIGRSLTDEMGVNRGDAIRSVRFWDTLEEIRRLIGENLPIENAHNAVVDIPHFNDHADTTFEDVRAVFEKARASA